MAIIRHQGTMKNTGSRVFVIFRELPADRNKCLVCYRDALPEQYVHKVTDIVTGKGQHSTDLYKVMEHETLEQGQMLTVLHRMGYLSSVNTADVEMHTGDSGKIQLNVLNDAIRQTSAETIKDGTVQYNPLETNITEDFVEQGGIVKNLLAEAEKHEMLARTARERLYNLDPTYRPSSANVEDESEGEIVIRFRSDITQSKAIELVKKELKQRREGK